MTDAEDREKIERYRAKFRRAMEDPEKREVVSALVLGILGAAQEAQREDEPEPDEQLEDILTVGFGTGPDKDLAMGRLHHRVYEKAFELRRPSRWRRAIAWLRRRFRSEHASEPK